MRQLYRDISVVIDVHKM